jgi:hypothetical protein
MPQSQNKGSGYWSPFEQNKHNFTKEMEFLKKYLWYKCTQHMAERMESMAQFLSATYVS